MIYLNTLRSSVISQAANCIKALIGWLETHLQPFSDNRYMVNTAMRISKWESELEIFIDPEGNSLYITIAQRQEQYH